jgi:distribution and morphology protein 31
MGTLRKQWLFFDMLSADLVTGQVDNCLFSLHKPQSIGRTSEEDLKDCSWKRMVLLPFFRSYILSCHSYCKVQSRFRIDGVPIDHLKTPRDTGPLTWFLSGKADLVADIRFPREPSDDIDLNSILGNIVDRFDEAVNSPAVLGGDQRQRIPGQPGLAVGKPLEAPGSMRRMLGLAADEERDARRVVSIDLDIRFKDLRAAIPVNFILITTRGVLLFDNSVCASVGSYSLPNCRMSTTH